jgi:hypothetical protein
MSFHFGVRTSVPATSNVANVLSGSAIEFLQQAIVLTIMANMDGGGFGNHTLTVNLAAAPLTPIPSSALNAASSAGTVKADEDLVLSAFPIPAGGRLVHFVSNSDAAAHNFNGRYFVQ